MSQVHYKDENVQDVFKQVAAIAVDRFDVAEDDVLPSSHFKNDFDADSLDAVELVMALTEHFKVNDNEIEITDEEAEAIETVEDAVMLVSLKMGYIDSIPEKQEA